MIELVPPYVLDFAHEFSKPRTPDRRSQGAQETKRQTRGEVDVLDTVASLMTWRLLTQRDLPVTFFLTARTGDETDLRVQRKGSDSYLDVNVKATKSPLPNSREDDLCDDGYLAVKTEELGIGLDDVRKEWETVGDRRRPYLLCESKDLTLTVEVDESGPFLPRPNGGRWPLADAYVKVFVHLSEQDADRLGYTLEGGTHRSCPAETHVHYCRWASPDQEGFRREFQAYLASVALGRPTMIWGIDHPGLWMAPRYTRPFDELIEFLGAR